RQDRDARLLRDVDRVPVTPCLLLHRVLLTEARVVHRPGVVLFHGVLDDQLPVGGEVIGDPTDTPHLIEAVRAELRPEVSQMLDQPGAGLREAHEDEALPTLAAHRGQPPVRPIEPRAVLHAGRAEEAPVWPIGPGMVRADDGATAAVTVEEPGAPVPAGVGEGTHLTVRVP